ncbi:MAG: hypothetical protein A3F53_00435 [Candidatus Zambryskibacteria bacterium RIFCSPHIGHO2_12_FULL_48_10]|uniref:ATP-grasp domain-containing protein n=1 Tax=Candidatus Zambryskibacteria bacterium RIFCSPHIGHO2_01_FULL_46_25 TaxID=1802738 RepID=A0A1G2SZ24_9BACT|nr:MAG: RimK-like protein ATP-grasp domain protein [Parcubacteria group bacterium GW2011_GWA1_47_10]OHA90102.1 MAG: hypothetical protein A2838_00520 [Candidatus Zambryskibacteria bacterium RIFCSPHIGHO2_01_FULL_46_25]OHB02013.1 MAG: hypothetical protein A3F53_00435 [Candidatus Zambryskibacteria bacterium RIFCSPHIGHO2_12_FULL_48_10]OHB06523.1 MAG: hypothetical protein A3A31_02735 [Candidatus Zambryskibacteria bacterium RIFCSPLOWO2_01_FULL_48_25]
MSTILILTHSEDDTAGMVIRHLKNMGVSHKRFNTDQFQKTITLSIYMDSRGKLQGHYHFPDGDLDFVDVGVVWNRRVKDPSLQETFADPEIRDWALQETRYALYNSFTLIDAPIVNPFENNERIKFNKLVQMRRASEMGFEVPRTCLTNQPESALDFCTVGEQNMLFILKKIRKGLVTLKDGRRLLLHTSVIPKGLINIDSMQCTKVAPLLLQNHIEKKYDVRSIVVGNEVFSFAIHSQETERGKTDFRTAAIFGEKLRHEGIDLGRKVNDALVAYTKSFGLAFSAIDLIVAKDDRIIFLEDNPNGQWGWLEEATGISISMAFARYLAEWVEKC